MRQNDYIHFGFHNGSVKHEPSRTLMVWASWNEVLQQIKESSQEWANVGHQDNLVPAVYLTPVSQIPLTCLTLAPFGSHLSRFSREIGPVWFSCKCKFCPHFSDLWFTTLEMFIYENWKLQLLKVKKISKRHKNPFKICINGHIASSEHRSVTTLFQGV